MSFSSFPHRLQKQRPANHGHDFRRARLETFEDRRMLSLTAVGSYNTGDNPLAVATADFNNDGHLDLVAANDGSNNVSVFLGNGNGTFAPAISSPAGYRPKSIAVGDFDDDGHLDVAAVNGLGYRDGFNSVVSVMFGHGDGSLEAPQFIQLDPNSAPESVAVGDSNSDGTMDLALASSDYVDF